MFSGASTRGFNGFQDFEKIKYDQSDFLEEENITNDSDNLDTGSETASCSGVNTCADSVVDEAYGDISENACCSGVSYQHTCVESVVDEAYRANYENRMIRNANKNCISTIFKIGAKVFLRKDINGNAWYHIKGMETFSYEDVFVVVGLDDGDNIWIETNEVLGLLDK